jgi:hypothetical protein
MKRRCFPFRQRRASSCPYVCMYTSCMYDGMHTRNRCSVHRISRAESYGSIGTHSTATHRVIDIIDQAKQSRIAIHRGHTHIPLPPRTVGGGSRHARARAGTTHPVPFPPFPTGRPVGRRSAACSCRRAGAAAARAARHPVGFIGGGVDTFRSMVVCFGGCK